MTSQADAIALYLESGHELTALDALELFGCLRLAARIKDLRERGFDIQTLDRVSGDKRFAAYRLNRPVQKSLFASSVPPVYGRTALAGEQAGAC